MLSEHFGFYAAGLHISSQLLLSSCVVQEEASGVGTPPPFARFHPNTVYDHRPGVTTEPRQPPDGI